MIGADTTARCVETTPFGYPVLPEVYIILASSSGSISTSGKVSAGETISSKLDALVNLEASHLTAILGISSTKPWRLCNLS